MSLHGFYSPELRQRILECSLSESDRDYIVRALEHLVELEEALDRGEIVRVKDHQLQGS